MTTTTSVGQAANDTAASGTRLQLTRMRKQAAIGQMQGAIPRCQGHGTMQMMQGHIVAVAARGELRHGVMKCGGIGKGSQQHVEPFLALE